MLRPILEALAEWPVPDGMGPGAPQTHFWRRAAERGVGSVQGDLLKWLVERALAEGRGDLVEAVHRICPATTLYRVLVPEGPFYPVVRVQLGKARTIYTQAQLRIQREARRKRLKHSGRRARRVESA